MHWESWGFRLVVLWCEPSGLLDSSMTRLWMWSKLSQDNPFKSLWMICFYTKRSFIDSPWLALTFQPRSVKSASEVRRSKWRSLCWTWRPVSNVCVVMFAGRTESPASCRVEWPSWRHFAPGLVRTSVQGNKLVVFIPHVFYCWMRVSCFYIFLYSGIIHLCKAGNSGIQSLIGLLCIPNMEVRVSIERAERNVYWCRAAPVYSDNWLVKRWRKDFLSVSNEPQ